MNPPLGAVPLIVVVVGVLIAASTDILTYKVHNMLTLPLLASGVLYHAVTGGLPGITASLTGALFGFGVLVVFCLMGGMGAGDVKLMAAIGAWLGLSLTFYVFIVSSIAAGVYALVLIVFRKSSQNTWTSLLIMWYRLKAITRHLAVEGDQVEIAVTQPTRRLQCIPFAAMIALGILGTLGWQLIVKAAGQGG